MASVYPASSVSQVILAGASRAGEAVGGSVSQIQTVVILFFLFFFRFLLFFLPSSLSSFLAVPAFFFSLFVLLFLSLSPSRFSL